MRHKVKRHDGPLRASRSHSTWRRRQQRQSEGEVAAYGSLGDESGMLMAYRRCRRCSNIVALPALHRGPCPRCGARRQ